MDKTVLLSQNQEKCQQLEQILTKTPSPEAKVELTLRTIMIKQILGIPLTETEKGSLYLYFIVSDPISFPASSCDFATYQSMNQFGGTAIPFHDSEKQFLKMIFEQENKKSFQNPNSRHL